MQATEDTGSDDLRSEKINDRFYMICKAGLFCVIVFFVNNFVVDILHI